MYEAILAFNVINFTEWARLSLLYSHLILCAFAIAAVLKTDYCLVVGSISRSELEKTAKSISLVLLCLWGSGLAIIYLDTGFVPEVLMGKPKLLFNLVCVCTLTLNGLVLHHVSFPVLLNQHQSLSAKERLLLVTTGSLSTSHWLLAAFIGLAKPLGRLSLDVLLTTYALIVLLVLFGSIVSLPLLNKTQLMRAPQVAG